MKMEGVIALVTGANRGIGRAFVSCLLQAGAGKVYASVRTQAAADELARTHGDQVVPALLDVTAPEMVGRLGHLAGDVTLLINNAGVAHFEGFIGFGDLDTAWSEMAVNYFGALDVIRAMAPVIQKNGGGTIVQISSIAGMVTFPVTGTYCASKAAVNAKITGARAELAQSGFKVIGVYPGVVETRMSEHFSVPGVPPERIVAATLESVIREEEDVFPDPMSRELFERSLRDPKAVETEFSRMLPEHPRDQ